MYAVPTAHIDTSCVFNLQIILVISSSKEYRNPIKSDGVIDNITGDYKLHNSPEEGSSPNYYKREYFFHDTLLQSRPGTGLSQDIRVLLGVLTRHFLYVVVTRRISHVPSVPSDMLGIHLPTIRESICLRDDLLRGFVFQDFLPTEIANLHRTFRGFLRHVIFS